MSAKRMYERQIYRFATALVVTTLVVACASVQPASNQRLGTESPVNESNTQPAATQSPSSTGETEEWSLAKAAEPYRGVTITASFLPRPGYEAAISLIPEFEKQTGITVK